MRVAKTTTRPCHYMAILRLSEPKIMDQIHVLIAGTQHAKASASPDSEGDWMMTAAISRSSFLNWLNERTPAGSFSKMSPEYCHPEEDGTLVPSSGVWANSGKGSWGQSLMLNMPAWRNGAAVCLLSDILERGSPCRKEYYLTKRACDGFSAAQRTGGPGCRRAFTRPCCLRVSWTGQQS